jgi:hypothetical protein
LLLFVFWEIILAEVMLTTDYVLFSQSNSLGVLRQTLKMISSGARDALHNEDRISRSLTNLTVMEWTPESLNLHRVDARDILVLVNTVHVVILEAPTQGASDHKSLIVRF